MIKITGSDIICAFIILCFACCTIYAGYALYYFNPKKLPTILKVIFTIGIFGWIVIGGFLLIYFHEILVKFTKKEFKINIKKLKL